MTDYTEFDKALIEEIRGGETCFVRLGRAELGEQARKLATPNGRGYRDKFSIIGRRLQALRKKGLIAYSSKKGWQIV